MYRAQSSTSGVIYSIEGVIFKKLEQYRQQGKVYITTVQGYYCNIINSYII